MEKINKYKNDIKEWILVNGDSRIIRVVLAMIAFSEASFFIIPPDFFLVPIILANKGKRWLYYSLLTVVFSVLGGILGYAIGALFFDVFGESLVSIYHLESELIYVGDLFAQNAFLSIFAAAFTPIPFKVFTLGAGLFNINLLTFIFASILGRGLRFIIVGYITAFFGEKATKMTFKYFNNIVYILLVIATLYLVFRLF